MSEDKMREGFDEWQNSDIPQFSGELKYKDVDMTLFDAWKAATEACAAIKDAEIAELKDMHCNELLDYRTEIASRDLMIKELREALHDIADENSNHPVFSSAASIQGVSLEQMYERIAAEALANSEHHNSRALEKMLLEATINGFILADDVADTAYESTLEEMQVGLLKLNKE